MQAAELISDKYRLERLVGAGGMAEVWSARNELTQRDFAIKVILPELSRNREAIERFLQEARATSRLKHPSLVNVFDVGSTRDGRPYLVMELLEGESLEALIERRGRLSPLWTALILAPIARALSVAHRAGIVHRDLSSANVFLASGGEGEPPMPKVLDFGVSKILEHAECAAARRVRTGNGAVLGSPAYMSPEQARGAASVDARSDVWALGVLLYECLCGEPPFRAHNYNALMVKILSTPHRPIYDQLPRLDAELAALVESCLIKDREARTQTAHEVASELEAIAERLADGTSQRISYFERPRASLPPRALLPARTLPLGVRAVRALKSGATPRTLAAVGALAGTTLGLAIGVQLAARGAPEAKVPAAPAVTTVALEPSVTPVESTTSESAPARAERGDLESLVAKGLGLPEQRAKRRRAPRKPSRPVAMVPRKHPY